ARARRARARPRPAPSRAPAARRTFRAAPCSPASRPPRARRRGTAAPASRAAASAGASRSRGRDSFFEQEGHGPVVHQLHLHHRPELPRLHFQRSPALLPQQREEAVVQGDRDLGRRGVHEARPPPLARIAIQSELGHHQHRPADVREPEIHPSLGVGEDAQAEDLVGHPDERRFGVAGREASQHDEPHPDLPGRAPSDAHFRARHALDHRPHAAPPPPPPPPPPPGGAVGGASGKEGRAARPPPPLPPIPLPPPPLSLFSSSSPPPLSLFPS